MDSAQHTDDNTALDVACFHRNVMHLPRELLVPHHLQARPETHTYDMQNQL